MKPGPGEPEPEVRRLEQLWSGEFGNQYVQRNQDTWRGREPFWEMILKEFPVENVLEVGCNIGDNLRCIARRLPGRGVWGLDINELALKELRRSVPEINALWSPARSLPFRDEWFDLTFTTGVLIHQPLESLEQVMREVVRTSRRYVLCGEYYAEKLTEVPYRGQAGALYKRDFGGLYQRLFPSLQLRKKGFLPRGEGPWDDVTYWVFEKRPV